MSMEIDDRKFRALYGRLVHLQHALWLVLRKLQRSRLGLWEWLRFRIRPPDPRSSCKSHAVQPLSPIHHACSSTFYCPGSNAGVAMSTLRGFPFTAPCHTLPPKVVMYTLLWSCGSGITR